MQMIGGDYARREVIKGKITTPVQTYLSASVCANCVAQSGGGWAALSVYGDECLLVSSWNTWSFESVRNVNE